jgi:hypothetical protein
MKKLLCLNYSLKASILWVNLSLVSIILFLTHQACDGTINLQCMLGLDRLAIADSVLINHTVTEAPWRYRIV